MGVNRYSSEGYPDPTTYDALSNIEQQTKAARAYRPMVYVCSPFSGDVAGNIANARKYSRFAVSQFLNDNDLTERELGLHFGNVLMSHCSEVWVFGKSYQPEWKLKSGKPKGKITDCDISAVI